MEESNNYGHQHPLLLILNQDQLIHNQSGVTHCSRCGDKVSATCFYCAEHCGFYLHKVCAEAPLELNHPFHLNHPLLLMQKSPHLSGAYFCSFCHEFGDKSVYHCSSCELEFHIKCALFTLNIAENNLKELEHVALHDPLISTENGDKKLKDVSKCFGCWEPLAMCTHFSPDCGFNLHEKCAELPFKLNHVTIASILLFYNLIANDSLARYAKYHGEEDLFMVVLLVSLLFILNVHHNRHYKLLRIQIMNIHSPCF
ncbi:hypothetical protein ERO13_D02G015333v2 [Gossypium hirsutum]|nr:hypothetical protein ERO13_D02G015333v2 [Gossypium hirsutum]